MFIGVIVKLQNWLNPDNTTRLGFITPEQTRLNDLERENKMLRNNLAITMGKKQDAQNDRELFWRLVNSSHYNPHDRTFAISEILLRITVFMLTLPQT